MTTWTPDTKNTTSYSGDTKNATTHTPDSNSDYGVDSGKPYGLLLVITKPAIISRSWTPDTKN